MTRKRLPFAMLVLSFVLGLLASSVPAHATATFVSCTPVEVMTFHERIHVRCAAAIGGIVFFAAPTQDTQFVNRVLSIIESAQVAGRTLSIQYDPADLSGINIGCQNFDCRLILAIGFGQ